MKKLIYGVGISGANRESRVSKDCYYECWRAMIRRCYSKKFQDKHPTYIGCSVCEEWLTFSNFKSWMENQDWTGKDLDKDLLVFGNKVYSPETCVFIDHKINSFTNDCAAKKGAYPTGVYFHKSKRAFMASCKNPFAGKREFIGYFSCPETAHLAWRKRKHEFACKFAEGLSNKALAKSLMERYL